MWAKRTAWVLAAAAGLSGCMAQIEYRPSSAGRPRPQDVAALNEAVELVAQLKYADAADKLSGLIPLLRTAGDRQHAAEAMFWLGYCYEKQGGAAVAATWYERVKGMYPNTPAARQAEQRLRQLPPAPPAKTR